MYLHPNNGLVPNNHLRSGRLMHQLTLFHMKPNKKPVPLEILSVHLQAAFTHLVIVLWVPLSDVLCYVI